MTLGRNYAVNFRDSTLVIINYKNVRVEFGISLQKCSIADIIKRESVRIKHQSMAAALVSIMKNRETVVENT